LHDTISPLLSGYSSTGAINSDIVSILVGKSFPWDKTSDVPLKLRFHFRPRYCGIPWIAITM